MRRFFRWSVAIMASALLLVLCSAAWLIATEGGARWLLHQASPYLPEALGIEEVYGNLLRGLEFRAVSWLDTAADIAVEEIDVRVELLPLLKREVRVTDLSVRDVDVSLKDSPPREEDTDPLNVDIPVALLFENVAIENARITRAGEAFTVSTIRLRGRLSGSALRIERFDLQSGLADIGLSGEAELSGNYAVSASSAWELRLPDQPTLSGVLRLDGNAAGYAIQHDLDAPYAVTSQGTVALADAGIFLDLRNSWDQIRIDQGGARVIELAGGMLRITGTPGDLDFDGSTAVSTAEIPTIDVQARGQFSGDRVDVAALSVVNDWGQLRADGSFLIAPEPSWSFDVSLSELDPSVADARFRGKLELTGRTSGRLVEEKPVLALVIEQLSGALNGYPVKGSGDFSYADERLQFDDTVLRIGDNSVRLDGSYGAELRLDAKARFPSLAQLGLGVSGALDGDIRFASNLEVFAASGYVSGEQLTWNGSGVDSLRADFELPVTGKGTIALQIDAAEQGRLSAAINGRFVDNKWSGALTTFAANREPIGEIVLRESADFSLSRSEFKLEKACLSTSAAAGELCAALNYDFSGPLEFAASVRELPVASLPQSMPQGATVLGVISTDANGAFRNGRLDANLNMKIEGLGLVTTFEGDEVSAKFEKAVVNANVADNKLVGEFELRLDNSVDYASGSIQLDDIFDSRSALLGNGALELNDLTLFSFFFPDAANPQGRILGNIEISGNLAAPEIRGEIGLRDGAVDVQRAGISVTDIGLLLRQSRAGELSLQGSAKSGDGYLQIGGETVFGVETGVRSDIRLQGEDFRLINLPDWQVTASPTIAVLFDERETRVSGSLAIPEASITVKSIPETTEKPSPDAIVHRGEAATVQQRRALIVDVTASLGEKVSFAGFGLSTNLEGAVRISGDSKSPYKGQGRVVLNEGRYRAYGQNLEIESGELIFNGPLTNPALNVRATRTATDKTVAGIHLTGTPTQLSSSVYSEPPLSDAEALSYLLTGRALDSASSAEGDMLNQAAFALGLTSAGSVASRVRNELGLETLGFQGGADNRQLVAGKRFGDRLFVEYAYGVIDSLGTLLLRYQLSQRLVVESRSGSVRNVDVVYSVKKP